jgi:PBP1b-binding outer membrane lipoprotein LpoB
MNPRLLLALLAALVLGGCAGYHLGPSNGMAAGDKSIQIRPFSNATLQPRLTDAVTAQLRREIQRDGTFRLATQDDGDIVVTGKITRYKRREMTMSTADNLTPVDFQVTLTAQVTARERSSGKLLLDNKLVTGSAIIRIGTDLTDAERQALPILAGNFAKNVTALLADGTW